MSTAFDSIPIIDFKALRDCEKKTSALEQLKHALFSVGFLYLVNTGIENIVDDTHDYLEDVFNLPSSVKDQCNMINSPSFLGYTILGAETTAARIDMREQFDFGSPVSKVWVEGDPFWQRLEGPSQYPDDETQLVAGRYIQAMSGLAGSFLGSVGECLSLPDTTFDLFRGNMDRLKFVKYPPSKPNTQGVGPHKDSTGLFTFLSQDTVGGLQVLNKAGEWIDARPIPGSLVVNIQQGFEAITGGLCPATTHRVISPTNRTRYSIPFFLGVRLDLTLEQLKMSAAEISRKIPASNGTKAQTSLVPSEFLSPLYSCFGEAQLRNRVLSHPDVGKKWYPDLFERYSRQVLK